MKPITDDVVFSIMQGLEKREKRNGALAGRTSALHETILKRDSDRRIISFDFARNRARRTVSGMFCYVARG